MPPSLGATASAVRLATSHPLSFRRKAAARSSSPERPVPIESAPSIASAEDDHEAPADIWGASLEQEEPADIVEARIVSWGGARATLLLAASRASDQGADAMPHAAPHALDQAPTFQRQHTGISNALAWHTRKSIAMALIPDEVTAVDNDEVEVEARLSRVSKQRRMTTLSTKFHTDGSLKVVRPEDIKETKSFLRIAFEAKEEEELRAKKARMRSTAHPKLQHHTPHSSHYSSLLTPHSSHSLLLAACYLLLTAHNFLLTTNYDCSQFTPHYSQERMHELYLENKAHEAAEGEVRWLD